MGKLDMLKTGKRIKELRTGLELSQKALAEKVGVAQNTIAQYEQGTSKISIEVLFNLAIILETTTDYLLGLEN